MATKPSVLPRVWASLTNYDTGPFIGSPMKVDPGAGPAASGHRPGSAYPTPAEYENYQQNHITDWVVNWVSLGSFTGAGNAHIVETGATGRTQIRGADMLSPANETVCNVSGTTNAAPVMIVRNTSTGPTMQVTTTGGSAGTLLSVVMSGAHTGSALDVSGTASSSGTCFAISVPSGSTSPAQVITQAANARSLQVDGTFSGGPGALITQESGPALTLTATGPTAVPLVLTPRNTAPSTAGAFWIDNLTNAPRFYDSTPTLKDVWASVSGMAVATSFTAGPTVVGVLTTAATNNTITMVSGQKYEIFMSIDIGRANASTANVLITATVNGGALPFSGYTLITFETGSNTYAERTWCKSTIYTAAATGNLVINLQVTPSGAGNIVYAQANIVVKGHYV